MPALALKRLGKSRFAQLSVLTVIVFVAIYATLLQQNNKASEAATALCYGQPGTHTAVAPSSVTPGQTFKITNITGAANTNIATVNSTNLTLSISGATPATVTENWNGGPVHGDYTSTYPDITLTATGAVGSQVLVNLDAIVAQVTIAGVDSTITCSTSNGQLTANSPGQSLNLAAISIVAPPASTLSSNKAKDSALNSTSPSSVSQGTQPATHQPTTNAADSQQSSATNEETQTQAMHVTVRDYKGQPVRGAKVVLDSMPAVITDSSGTASFKAVNAGTHNLSVIANNQTLTQTLQLDPQNAGKVLGIQVQLRPPSHKLRNLIIGGVFGLLAVIAGLVTLARWLRRDKNVLPSTAPMNPAPTVPVIPTSPSTTTSDPFKPQIIRPSNSPNTMPGNDSPPKD